jgi:hypothetical protein
MSKAHPELGDDFDPAGLHSVLDEKLIAAKEATQQAQYVNGEWIVIRYDADAVNHIGTSIRTALIPEEVDRVCALVREVHSMSVEAMTAGSRDEDIEDVAALVVLQVAIDERATWLNRYRGVLERSRKEPGQNDYDDE